METRTAEYREAFDDALFILDELKIEIEQKQGPHNYGYVSDILHVKQELKSLLAFLRK